MPEFFQTMMGRKFFEGQLPKLISTLERIAVCLEENNEKSHRTSRADRMPEVPVDSIPAASGSDQ